VAVPVQFKPGALFKVPAGDDYGYGVMLSQFPYMAFYGKSAVSDEQGLPVGPPLFVVLVTKAAYSTGRWGKPLRLLPENETIPILKFFSQSVINKFDCKIIDPVAHRKVTARPSECIGLEREAVWSPEHIESRILDTYAGRPNIYADSLQPKL
jgi:hypothetical protein